MRKGCKPTKKKKKKNLEIGKRKGYYPIRKASHRERLTIPYYLGSL
jgi:hypothetical protein